eukprot:Em0010g448a
MKGGKQKKHVPTSQIHRPSSHNAEVNSRLWLILPAVFTAFVAIGVFISEKWFLGPHVNVPLDLPSVLEGSWRNESVYRDRLWGTYRSNVYFGIRPRLPRSVIAGVMWMTYDGGFNVRHTCEHGDGLQSFGWLKHDGVSFGQQDIVDNALHLKTEFLSSADRNLGDSWTARVSGRSRGSRPSLVSLVLYVYNEGDGAMDLLATTRNTVEEIFGHSTQLKEFRVYFPLMNVSKDAELEVPYCIAVGYRNRETLVPPVALVFIVSSAAIVVNTACKNGIYWKGDLRHDIYWKGDLRHDIYWKGDLRHDIYWKGDLRHDIYWKGDLRHDIYWKGDLRHDIYWKGDLRHDIYWKGDLRHDIYWKGDLRHGIYWKGDLRHGIYWKGDLRHGIYWKEDLRHE